MELKNHYPKLRLFYLVVVTNISFYYFSFFTFPHLSRKWHAHLVNDRII